MERKTAAVVGLLIGMGACSSPTKPSVTVAAGRPSAPANGTQISYYSQPVTLTVVGGVASAGQATTAVELATDSAFTANVVTKPVAQSANGQLTVMLDHLSPSTTYYWRVKTSASDNGVVSATQSFSVGPRLVIQPPVPVQPLAGSFPHKRPTFTVTNAGRTGPEATLTYRFDVAADAAFSTVVASGTVPEGSGQTSFVPLVDLTSGATYYWRAQASDTTKGEAGGYSTAQRFMTIIPDDGRFRYTFVLHIPDVCEPYKTPEDVPVDGPLLVNGDQLRFSVFGQNVLPGEELSLDIARAGSQLSGTIGGTWRIPPTPITGIAISYTRFGHERVLFSGSADNDGRLSGSFDGYVWAGNFAYTYLECAARFTWTLTPHP
jgi:hypothetical protein